MLIPVLDWKALWKRRGPKVVLIGLGTILIVAGAGTAGYYLWPEPAPPAPPPANTLGPNEARAFIASDDFERLPMDQRIDWVEERMKRLSETDDDEFHDSWRNMDEQTRDRLRKNIEPVIHERMKREIDTYHSLPGPERTAFLDKRIDEMGRFRRSGRGMMGGRRGPPPPPGGGARAPSGDRAPPGGPPRRADGRRGPGRMMAHMARMPADRRARTVAYMKAMRKRMQERGLGRPGPPGPPGPRR